MGENLFEEEFTIEALSQMGNPLEKLWIKCKSLCYDL